MTHVRGIVITSGKDSFAGGMDLNVIAKMKQDAGDDPARGLFDGLMHVHAILRKIERAGMDDKNRGGKPVAAALPGTALGIGFEIPLACHRIFAADNPKAKIGLPEIMVGIFPGSGGTTRVSRKLGAMAAAPILLEGKLFEPKKAKSAGLVDEVVAPDELLEKAKAWVLSAGDADIVKPWDQKGWKMPGGAPYQPGRLHDLRRRFGHGERQDPRRLSCRQRPCFRPSTRARSCPSTPRSRSRRAGSRAC